MDSKVVIAKCLTTKGENGVLTERVNFEDNRVGDEIELYMVGEECENENINSDDSLMGGEGGESRGEEGEAIPKFLNRGFINVSRTDLSTHTDPQVGGFRGKGDLRPGGRGGGGEDITIRTRDGASGDNVGFVNIDSQTRDTFESIYKRHRGNNRGEIGRGDSEIISKSAVRVGMDVRERVDEWVVAEGKEDGGEGAALFDPPGNSEEGVDFFRENRIGPDIRKERVERGDEPGGHVNALESGENIRVIDRIKGFSCVKKEDVMGDFVHNSRVEFVVEVAYMF